MASSVFLFPAFGISISGGGSVSLTGPILVGDGTVAAPSYSFTNDSDTGFYSVAAGFIGLSTNGAINHLWGPAEYRLGSTSQFGWSANATPSLAAPDTILVRDAANTLALKNGTNAQEFRIYGTTTGTKYLRLTADGSTVAFTPIGGMNSGIYGGSTGGLYLGGAAANQWNINPSGHILAGTDNTYDIGASGATRPRNLYLGSSVKQVGGVTTDGSIGSSITVGGPTQRKVGATNAQTIGSFTVGAADATFRVSANILITTATAHSFTVTCAYTDEGNTARTLTLNFSTLAGVISNTAIGNAAGAVPYNGVTQHIRCKAATTITIATVGTFTTVTYNGEGYIEQLG